MLVRQTNRVAELVGGGAAVEKAEIHRCFIGRNCLGIGADIAPSAIVLVEGNANVCVGCVVESEREISVVAPLLGLLLGGGLLLRVAVDETHV